jgi:hypothetical protein
MAGLVVPSLSAQSGKTPALKEIMSKLNKKGGLLPTIGAELKEAEPKWAEIQQQTRDYAALAAVLGKNTPPMGEPASWEKLTQAFADTAKEMEAAAQQKDKAATQAAHRKLTGSCSACHNAHK